MSAEEPFAILYDLADQAAWDAARRHSAWWGRLYTDIHTVDNDHVMLLFRPAPKRPGGAGKWEEIRKQRILEDAGARDAALPRS
jgi:hypothetical protein